MANRKNYLPLAEIRSAPDLPITEVEVPEWGGTICIRPMTAGEWIDYQSTLFEPDGDGKARIRQDGLREAPLRRVGTCMVHPETRERLFASYDDACAVLGAKS